MYGDKTLKKSRSVIAALFITSLLVTPPGFAEEKTLDAEQTLRQWENSLNKNDLPGVLALYASDAVLWGTFSKTIRNTPDLIREYFEALLQKENVRVVFGATESKVYKGVHLFSGSYEFSYEDDGIVVFPSRFTFAVCKVEDGSYKIIEHHSSVMPD